VPEYVIRTTKLKPQPTAAIHVVCEPSGVGDAMWEILPEIGAYLEGAGVAPVGGPFARFFDYTEDVADFEGGFTLSEPVAGEGRIEAGELPGGLAAITTHEGPLEELEAAHDAIGEWVLAGGHDPAGPVWEVYVVGPAMHADPAKLHTDVVWPLRK
jgi:effector-binding domain-containing protein